MNEDRIQGKWKQLKGSIQEKWGKLTNDDLDVVEGNTAYLAGKIQERYGMAKDEPKRRPTSSTSRLSAEATSACRSKKSPAFAGLFLAYCYAADGGGGGSRTRVRRRLTPSTTCLAHRSISSSGSTMCETHRLTSLKGFAVLPSDGGIRLSHDNDGTSTSMSTSGFPAYALSGESVVVVVGN